MSALRVRRVGPSSGHHFALSGPLDARGAITMDRLLSGCREYGAPVVHLDLTDVNALCPLAGGVLARHGRLYEDVRKSIVVNGLTGPAREAIAAIGTVIRVEDFSAAGTPAPGLTLLVADSRATGPVPAPGSGSARAGLEPPPTGDPITPPNDVAWTAPCVEAGGAVADLQTQLKRKILQFRNLFDVTRALNLASDMDDVLSLFALSVMGHFGMERLAIFLPNRDRGVTLAVRYAKGFPHEHFRDLVIPPEFATSRAKDGPLFGIRQAPDAEEDGVMELLVTSGFEWGAALRVQHDLEGLLLLGGHEGRKPLLEEQRELLTILVHQASVAIANARIRRDQEERNLGLVRGMMSLIESRDPYERGSTERVVRLVHAMALMMQIPRTSLRHLSYGAILRDIGMISTGGLNLKNPARLSEHEWALIRQHPTRGAQTLEEMNFPGEVVDIVLNHHERWGGEGYPRGIRGQEIPLSARIVAIADAYVSMTSDRPYRRALPRDRARQVITENWGTPFDPDIIEVFLGILDRVERRSRRPAGAGEGASGDTPQRLSGGADGARVELDPYGAGATIPPENRT